MEVESLKEGAEGRVSVLEPVGEVAAVDLANEDDHPDEHRGHPDEAREDTLDEVDDEQVRRVPRPEHRVS